MWFMTFGIFPFLEENELDNAFFEISSFVPI